MGVNYFTPLFFGAIADDANWNQTPNVLAWPANHTRGFSGYQKPRVKEDGAGNKWWFYKKDEIYDLLADGEYLSRRDRSRRAKLLSLGRAVPNMETEW